MGLTRINMEATFSRALLPLARRWRAEADKTLAALGLSHASGWVLLHVGRLGDAVRQSDLAAAVDIRGPSMVRLIDRLEADRLIERRVEAHDRRINRIHLTDDGHALVERIEQALQEARAAMFAGVETAELAVATRVLQHIDRRIGARARRAR
jgi:MarR family transcriptional regulator for hemolysin